MKPIIPEKTNVTVSYKISPLSRDRIAFGARKFNELAKDSNISQSNFFESLLARAMDDERPLYIIDGVPFSCKDIYIKDFEDNISRIKEISLGLLEKDLSQNLHSIIDSSMKQFGYTSGYEYINALDFWIESKYYEELYNFLKFEYEKKHSNI